MSKVRKAKKSTSKKSKVTKPAPRTVFEGFGQYGIGHLCDVAQSVFDNDDKATLADLYDEIQNYMLDAVLTLQDEHGDDTPLADLQDACCVL